jgi:hypothetical protein
MAYGLLSDVTDDGRRLKSQNVIDEHSRFCPAILGWQSLRGHGCGGVTGGSDQRLPKLALG